MNLNYPDRIEAKLVRTVGVLSISSKSQLENSLSWGMEILRKTPFIEIKPIIQKLQNTRLKTLS